MAKKLETYTVHSGINRLLRGQMVASGVLNIILFRWQLYGSENDLRGDKSGVVRCSQQWIADSLGVNRVSVSNAVRMVLVKRGYVTIEHRLTNNDKIDLETSYRICWEKLITDLCEQGLSLGDLAIDKEKKQITWETMVSYYQTAKKAYEAWQYRESFPKADCYGNAYLRYGDMMAHETRDYDIEFGLFEDTLEWKLGVG